MHHLAWGARERSVGPFPQALGAFLEFTGGGALPVICMKADEAVFQENCRLSGGPFPFAASWHRLRPCLQQVGVDTQTHASGGLYKLTANPRSQPRI